MDLKLSLAPLAGYTDRAFRTLAKEFGADLVYSEMISAKAVCYGDRKTHDLADFDEIERPILFQLFGSEPRDFEIAAGILAERYRPEGFDINCGCPVPKIVKSGEGSELMRSPALIGRIVEATKKAGLPVSVKLRTGVDEAHKNVLDCARAAVESGATLIAVHGRSREGGFSAPIDFESIARVREEFSDVEVAANGGITNARAAKETIEKTGVTHLMLARGALGHPWLFDEIKAAFRGEDYTAPDLYTVLTQHLDLACRFKPVSRALPEMRSQLAFYFKGLRGAAQTREKLMRAASRADIDAILKEFFNR
ncbi:MAG: tRNA-dihydrouridine synthase [Clostridia bacterium]|nr:tRNA-dihydrouridine synthase [Clostridia bacterium]